jgi:hypothetical protein
VAITSIYWVSTALLSLLYVASALSELGYTAPLLVPFMIIVKLLGPVAILWHFDAAISDLAYAGIFYHLLLSGMAHLGVRKPKGALPAALGLIFLVASFATQNAARGVQSPHAPTAAIVQSIFESAER